MPQQYHAYFRYLMSPKTREWLRVASGTEAECWHVLRALWIPIFIGSACVLEDGLTPVVGPMRILRRDEGHGRWPLG